MKERKISQYALYTHYGISTSFLDKLRHNENVEIRSLDILCSIPVSYTHLTLPTTSRV